VRYVENEPEQSLEFWREALRQHMEAAGYALVEERDLRAPAGNGALFEWVAPVGEEEWIYLTAVVHAGSRLAVAEAAGPSKQYRAYREDLHRSLETIGGE
jgi:hypothetical protein